MVFGSKFGFLIKGTMRACLSESGNTPDVKDALTILVIVGRRSSRQSLNTLAGDGSSGQAVIEDDLMALRTVSSSTQEKSLKELSQDSSIWTDRVGGLPILSPLRNLMILSWRILRRSLPDLSDRYDQVECEHSLVKIICQSHGKGHADLHL